MQDMLARIVVLLLAIADLAERAAGASDARRRLVLDILRSGEAAARDAFIVSGHASAERRRPPADTRILPGDGPEDAMALAASLRALALIVRAMAALHGRLALLPLGEARDGRRGGGLSHRLDTFIRRFADTALPPAPCLDTS